MGNLLPHKKDVQHEHTARPLQAAVPLWVYHCCSTAFVPALDRQTYLPPSPNHSWAGIGIINSGLHQLKLLWSSIFRDHGDPKNILLNSSPHEMASDRPCEVADHKSAETSKSLQSVLISTKWYLLMRAWISRTVPAAPLSGKRNGKKKRKTSKAFVCKKTSPARGKKKIMFVLLTVETWSREEQGNFTCSCEQAAADSFPR